MSQASITMDIRAQVTGYELSLAKFLLALSKLNPGSDIAKKISAAFSVAEKLVLSLGKNMLPKATNDTLIDALVGKVNAAGESIREVMDLFSHIDIGDLDLSKIGGEFTTLTTKIGGLQSELDTKLNAGLLEAVKNSTELSLVFSLLGTDLSKADTTTLFTDIEKAANKALSAVAEAEKKVTDLELSLNASKTRESDLLKSPFGTLEGKLNLDDTVKNIESLYDNVFSTLRDKMKTGLLSLGINDATAQNKLLDNFFNGLTPDNIRSKIEELFNTLKSSDLVSKKTEMYLALFGVDGNINAVIKTLNLNGLLEPIKELLHNLIESIKLLIGGKNAAKIEELIAKDDLENAAKTTLSVITKVYGNVQDAIVKEQQTTARLTAEMGTARAAVDSAKTNQTFIDNANILLKNDYDALVLKNVDLLNLINELKQQVANLLAKNVASTQATAKAGGNIANLLHLSTDAARAYKEELAQVTAKEQMVGKIQGVVQRWFSIYAAIRMVENAVRAVISTIQELDRTITEIAIVTDMNQGDLWKQMPLYTALAREYAASISGVYQVSQLYYQQGLETADVLALTELTLKMARISGLDYALATDYMTNALRSFKMEMSDALSIVDVYSAIAAASATDTTELASAMSKTASSAEAVGSSFLNTTAMMAVMIEATRESAENIGSAMKSIISRYGEMTSDPSKLVDSEGQEMSLNRVDKALQTVGITIHDTMGLFRDFDDVIMELAEKWDTIDKNTLRYIATIMAGNRQQSRFLALVSSYDRLKELSETAENSEDASQLQFLKTLDSVDAKIQQFLTSILDLYVNSGLENVYKGALDWANSLITTLDLLSTNDGLIVAIGKIGSTFTTLATLVTNIFSMIKGRYAVMKTSMQVESKVAAANEILIATEKHAKVSLIYDAETLDYVNATEERIKAALTAADEGVMAAKREAKAWEEEQVKMQKANKRTKGGMVASALGLGATMIAGSLDVNKNRGLKAGMTGIGAALSGIGTGFMVGGAAGGIIGVLTALPGIIEAIGMASESAEERLKRLQDAATESNNKRIQTNAAYTDLKDEVDLVKELAKTYEDSAEAKAEYYEHSNAIAEQYPMLVSAYDGEGNAILNLSNAYEVLKKARGEASDAAIDNAVNSVEAAEEAEKLAKDKYNEAKNTFWNTAYEATGIRPSEKTLALNAAFFQDLEKKYPQTNGWKLSLIFDVIKDGGKFNNESIIAEMLNISSSQGLQSFFSDSDKQEQLKQEIEQLQDDYSKNILQWVVNYLHSLDGQIDILPETGDLLAAEAVTTAARKAGIALVTQLYFANAKLEADYNNGTPADYLSEFTAVGSIINDKIYSLWELAKQDNAELKFDDWIKSSEVTTTYTTLMQELSSFWEGLNPDKQTELNTLIANRGKYTRTEFTDKFEELTDLVINTNDELEEWYEELLKYYEDNFDVTKLNKALEKRKAHREKNKEINLDQIIKDRNEALQELGPDELRNILSIYDSLEKRISSGAITESTGGEIFEQYIDSFKGASDKVQSLLTDVDIFSFSSIMDLIHMLEGEDFSNDESAQQVKEKLEQLAHLIPLNLNTEIETLTHAFGEGISDFETTIKNVTKGMNFKTMASEADKLGLEFSDFELKDGKYYIKDYLALSLLLIKDLNSLFEDLSKKLNAQKADALSKSGFVWTRLGISADEYKQLLEEFAQDTDSSANNIIEYYFEQKQIQLKSSVGAATAYANDLLARTALESGQIETFAKLAMGMNEAGEYLFDQLIPKELIMIKKAILSGDISKIPENLREHYIQFSSLVTSTYTSIESSLATSLLGALSGGPKSITVTDTNISHLQDLLRKGWIKGTVAAGQTVTIADEVLKGNTDFETWLIKTYTTEKDLLEALQKYHKALYSNNTFDNLASLQKNGTVNYEDFTNYLVKNRKYSVTQLINPEAMKELADTYGLARNAAGNYIVTDWSKYVDQLTDDLYHLLASGTASSTDINAARAAVRNATVQQGNAQREALKNIIDNYLAVTVNLQQALADSLSVDMATLDLYFITRPDGTGTKELRIGAIKQAIADGTLEVAEGVGQYFREQILSIADAYLENITNATALISKGATNISDMEEFTKKYVELTGDNKTREALFNYDEIIDAWTLDPTILTEYVEAQAQELVNSGLLTANELQSYIDTNVRLTLALSIDIGSFLAAENKRATGKPYLTLKKSLVNYFKSSDVLLEKLREDYINSQIPKTAPQDVQEYIRSAMRSSVSAETIADYYISLIKLGGTNAVQIMRAVAEALGNELSASDIEAAYRVEVSEIENALDQLTYGIGSMVSGKAVKILQDAGYELVYLDENNAVITGIQDISAAYQAYYDALVESGEATLAAINEAKAKILETKDNRGKEQSAIDALSNATGMTYTAFAEILSNAGIEMTDELIALLEDEDHVIKHVGGNKMSIIDFSKFAEAMGWNFKSEEYISAFKSYNDSLIEMNRKAEKNIVEEVTALKDAKPGDQLNVTLLWAALRDNANEAILENLRGQLKIYGASIKDGILTLDESANLYEIARAIEQAAQDANLDLQDGLQEIADTVKEILQSYVEAIKKGIAGGLTNKETSELKSIAQQVGYNQDLRFVETTEGLKLAQDSAIGLYMALKDIDAMLASLVFDELNNSLKEANEHYQSISSILARILEIESLRSKGKSNKALEEELALAKEILAVRSTTEDEGFNFMSNKIPAALNNPLNYAKNWTLALLSLRDAFKVKSGKKSGFLEYTDFYNIVTEMNNIAALGKPIQFGAYTLDGSLESAAALIEKGAASLKAVNTGEVMVNLGEIGFNMAKGGKMMQDGVTDGIHSIAQSQIDMLDGLISVLETIVAMEQLGDIAGEDMNIDLGDIFDITYNDDGTIQSINGFTSDFEAARKAILDKAAEGTELRETLDHTKVKMGDLMRSMTNLLEMSAKDLFPDSLGPEGQRAAQESYLKMMNALYQAAISGEYNLDNIADSVKKVVEASGIDLQDFVFEYTDKEGKVTRVFTYVGETMVDIDFTNDDIRKQVNNALDKNYKNADEYRAAILTAIDAYKTGKNANGEPLTLEEKYNARTLIGLASNEFVLTDNKNGTYTGTYQGQKFTGTRDDVLRAMAEAATYKDAGYNFTVETNDGLITVKGKTKIGKTEVEIVTDKFSGELWYKYKGEKYKSQDDIMGALAEDGKIEDIGTYTFTDEGGRMHVTEVKLDAALSLTYTYYVDEDNTPHYKYNGQDFESYKAMRSYMEVKNEYDPTGGKEHIDKETKASYIDVNEHATVRYTITAKGITPTYEIDGKLVGDKAAFDAYCLAYALEGIDISTTEDISNNERVILYNYNGTQLQVRINLYDGGVTYSYDGQDGFTAQSENESAVKAAIAAHYQMESGSQEDTTEQTVDITIELGVNVQFVIKDGKVEIAEGQTFDTTEQQTAAEQLKTKMQAELDKNPLTLENPVKAEATSVTITLAGNALVTLDGDVKLTEPISEASGTVETLKIKATNTETDGGISNADIKLLLEDATVSVIIDKETAIKDLEEIAKKVKELDSAKPKVLIDADNDQAISAINEVTKALEDLDGKTVTTTVMLTTYNSIVNSDETGAFGATGNIGLAKAKGTLMGELGPELVVSDGRYFVAGQNGPEMVDLADDAIVFNHLQTKSLLEKGTSPGRGKAITNERNAVAFATGNINGGPAMASASAALATLKELRAQWQALLGISAKDLAGKGGSGGGGGGDKDKAGNFVKELEKWYNWLQEIAELEEQINYQEKLRSKIQSDMIPHGQDIATSYMTSLDALEKEIAVQEDLRNAQQEYFDQRRAWMNSNLNPFSSLYTFDENGQLKYANGKLEELSNMVGRNEEGKANYDAKEQYEMIQAMGYGDFLKYDSSGKEIELYLKDKNGEYKLDKKGEKMINADAYTTAVQAFWDKIDADKEEMQSLHDSINEHRDAVLEKQLAMNEILKSIEDNLIAVENKVLDAMVDSRERAIEESEKERAAIEKSSQSLIKGLSDQLNKERAMYEQLQDKNELNSLQRRLGILQRSGGSASEIASLQEQISLKQLDAYFDAQLNLIDALQEASDNELARLDALIELAKETLEYEKMHGLLWQKVSDVLAKSPTEIASYIQQNNSKYWGQSRTQLAQTIREDLMKAMEFKKIQENFDVIAAYYKAFDDAANAGAKGKWTQDDLGRWQYQKANGDLTKNSWEKVDDKWYRFDENGYMQTGWVKDQDQWYHLGESGAMDTGWFQDADLKWYYLDETSGAMLSNTTKLLMWNGEKANHSFDETGAWTGSTPIEKKEEEEKEDLNEENSSNENKKYKVTYKITGTSGDLSPGKTTGYGIGNTEEEARNNALNLAKRKANSIANAKISYSNPVLYEYGGIVLKDGEGYLHAKEGVLTAQLTSTLRNEILGNRNDSLLSLLTDFREAWSETKNAYSSITRDSSVVIEHAEVNMNVESIDNDYGAQRAGEQALNLMMQIARKTQAQNRVS